MTSSAATSTQDRLLAAPTIRQSTPSTSSPVPQFKSLALMIATQTYIMLPNLNQYLFFSSQKAAAATTTTTTTTTHSHQTSGLTSIVLDRRWQTGGDEQDQDEDNESEIIETTSDPSTQINRSDKLQDEDINHDTSNDNDLNNNNNDIADDTQRREQERLERFRKLGAQLRAISDEFARLVFSFNLSNGNEQQLSFARIDNCALI